MLPKAIINCKEVLIRDRDMYLWAKDSGAHFLSDSHLFWEFVLILDHAKKCNPHVKFLLENTKMRAEFLSMINIALGVDSVLINSSLVSAQSRERHYWANWHIEQPKKEYIYLKDIIDDDITIGAMRGRCIVNGTRQDHRMLTAGRTTQRIELRNDGKSNTLTTVMKDNLVVKIANINPSGRGQNGMVYDIHSPKSPTITTNKGEGPKVGMLQMQEGSQQNSLFEETPLFLNTHTEEYFKLAVPEKGWKFSNDSQGNLIYWRTLTPLECERLQTLPDGFTDDVSKTQRIRLIGNSWNIDTMVGIFKTISEPKYNQERLFT